MKITKLLPIACLCLTMQTAISAQTFRLESKDLNGQFTAKYISNIFGCSGENRSPELYWADAPAGTQSFAITMYDQDAPTGSGWWHWIVFDLPPETLELKRGAGNITNQLLPKGAVQGLTDFGTADYGGACPPEHDKPHAYIITVYALSTQKLGLDKNATPALVGFMLNKNVMAKASLIVYSKR